MDPFFNLKLSDREKGKIYLIFLLSLWDIVFVKNDRRPMSLNFEIL